MTNKAKFNLSMGVLGTLTLLGFGALIYQLTNGLGVTGMNNVVSWGLYIIMFMFFIGLSAGGLIVSSSATVFNIPSFKVVAKPATILSTVCVILATIFIMVDLGGPFRMFNLILHGQFQSPLMWDVVVISLYLAINIAYLYFMTRKNTNKKWLKTTSYIALPIAILVHSVTAWIFGLQIARAGWHSAIMAPLFVASALDSGLALLLIVLILLKKFKVFHVENSLITTLAGLLFIFVAVDAYFVFSEILTMFYPQEESTMLILNEMMMGSMAPFFWGEVILGIIIPLSILLLKKNRQKISLVVFSSALIVIGVLCKRIWLVISSFIFPNVSGSPGVTTGQYIPSDDPAVFNSSWTTVGQYTPSLIELTIVVGMVAFGILMFIALSRIIIGKSDQSKLDNCKPMQEHPQ
ncbi:polysulfide reductase NrfD [Virgibacillus sp. NKC19-3]|uniref:NrfD/PsrC family molybdoenzyme membrane anchor subunit n=1 Tax=Virgibacillus saliphilus TaxID=2831674 RepID=UPI001C9B542D|nr:NrfD/PsrC family molybdoenzyme membrane anchor subunit [Virgibacillus sp. NKC19-3]MBY7142060.1 polysulfide reductase NrfD [Virgibacillus sp. NKC19-3]